MCECVTDCGCVEEYGPDGVLLYAEANLQGRTSAHAKGVHARNSHVSAIQRSSVGRILCMLAIHPRHMKCVGEGIVRHSFKLLLLDLHDGAHQLSEIGADSSPRGDHRSVA